MCFVSRLSWLCNKCTLFLSFLDSATMYFVSQLSGLCNYVLCFPAFWTLQQCALFSSFLDSATNVLCLSAFWTQRRWCERRQWTWWASSFCTSRSSSTNTTICSYPGSWLVTFQNFYQWFFSSIPPKLKKTLAWPSINHSIPCGVHFYNFGLQKPGFG